MALIQPAPSTPADVLANRPLDIPPEAVAEMTEAEWYAKVYRGDDVPQLTLRAILMGSVLGFFLAFTNLYIGLKTGWHLGVAITACILSYSIWTFFVGVGVAKTPMSILENNCMQSTASAAGYSTGGTMVSAIAALLILSATPEHPFGKHLPVGVLVGWTVFLAILGVVLAIPMKRNLINQERLKFPSGLAAAVTLQSLYASGSEASRKAKALLISAIFGAMWPPLIELNVKDGEPLLPGKPHALRLAAHRRLHHRRGWGADPREGVGLDDLLGREPGDGRRRSARGPAGGGWMAIGGLVLGVCGRALGPRASLDQPERQGDLRRERPGQGLARARPVARRADPRRLGCAQLPLPVALDPARVSELRRRRQGRGRRGPPRRRDRGADLVVWRRDALLRRRGRHHRRVVL
jgi:hypothetical protein